MIEKIDLYHVTQTTSSSTEGERFDYVRPVGSAEVAAKLNEVIELVNSLASLVHLDD